MYRKQAGRLAMDTLWMVQCVVEDVSADGNRVLNVGSILCCGAAQE